MGGKSGTTTQTVQIPPEVLARYNSVNAQAQKVAQQPFQQYSTDPNAFVAQLTPEQQQGIGNINQYANYAQPAYTSALGQTQVGMNQVAANQNLAQPYYQTATGQTLGATQNLQQAAGLAQPAYNAALAGTVGAMGGYNPQAFQSGVQGYMSPFIQNAMNATAAQMQNVNQQQQQALSGNAINAGAFGGDRSGIAQANLMNQQNLALGQTLGQMAQQGYQSAAQNYLTGLGQQGALAGQLGQLGAGEQLAAIQGQQAVLGGAQQLGNLGAQQQTAALQGVPLTYAGAAQLGQLGAGAQGAGLAGAQAQIGAGTLQQQTNQAGLSALYNQFLQQQAYPFQVAQFLANIAEGTGALSGSTTTTTQPMPFFSDRRLKENVERIGETDEGLPIHKFNYKGDPQKHIGFMADEVEKVHPEAVGLHPSGYKMVDYDRATSEGGAVGPQHAGLGFADGGSVYDQGSSSIGDYLMRQQAMYEKLFGSPAGQRSLSGIPGVASRVPESQQVSHQLMTAGAAPKIQSEDVMSDLAGLDKSTSAAKSLYDKAKALTSQPAQKQPDIITGKPSPDTPMPPVRPDDIDIDTSNNPDFRAGGRIHRAAGGDLPYEDTSGDQKLDIPEEENKYGLVTPQNPTGQSGGGSGLGQALGLAKGLGTLGMDVLGGTASMGTMGSDLLAILPFLAKGGRVHKDDGGGLTPSEAGYDPAKDPLYGPVAPPPLEPVREIKSEKPIGYTAEEATPPQKLTGSDFWRDYASKSAVKAGLNPTTALGIGQLESAFNPFGKPGDEGSSFGIYQLHYGGMSNKYPHSGLGDLFTKETGYDLRDPNVRNDPDVVKAQIDWTTNYMAKHGIKDWSTAKMLTSGQPVPTTGGGTGGGDFGGAGVGATNAAAGLGGAGGTAPAPTVGQAAPTEGQTSSKGGLGDFLTSEKFLIPLLSGIGTMASSKSPFLGAAILQGLGGGAKAYEDIQNQMLERQALQPVAQQRQIETMNSLVNGLMNYNATNGTNLSLPEYARMVGYTGPIPPSAQPSAQPYVATSTAASGQPQVGVSPAMSPQELQTAVVPRDGVQIPAMSDPLSLRSFIQKYGMSTTPAIQEIVKTAQHNLDQITATGKTTDVNGNQINAPGAIASGQQGLTADQRVKLSGAFEERGQAFRPASQQIMQNLRDLEDVYAQLKSGPETAAKANFDRVMSALDPKNNFPALHTSDAGKYDEAVKSAIQLQIAQLQGMSQKAPASELSTLSAQIPLPNLSPEAIHKIISRTKANIDYQQKMYDEYDPEASGYNVSSYQKKFFAENPYEKFVEETEKGMKPAAGTSSSSGLVEGQTSKSKSGRPIVVKNGEWVYQ
jgi:Chaperone of endosialidase